MNNSISDCLILFISIHKFMLKLYYVVPTHQNNYNFCLTKRKIELTYYLLLYLNLELFK